MSFAKYIIGYVLSALFTLCAFGLLWLHIANHHVWPTHGELVVAFFALALAQFLVQLFCFLHLDFSRESRERLVVMLGAAGVVCILVGGSLWIMYHLNERMMADPSQMEQYMSDQGGF